MKKGSDHPDSTRKKLVGDLLRNADKLLKEGDYERAFGEVEKSLELEPGNFYAQAYRDRISALREKHGRPATAHQAAAPGPVQTRPPAGNAGDAEAPTPPGLTEITGAHIEEIPAGEPDAEEGRDLEALKDQIARDRASHEDATTRQAEEFARQALEDELRRRGETDRLKAAEQAAVAAAMAEAREEAVDRIIAGAADTFRTALSGGDTEGAFRQLETIRIVSPTYAGLGEMTRLLEAATVSALDAAGGEAGGPPRESALEWYGKLLRSAWGEGKPNEAQAGLLAAARARFAVTPEEEKRMLSPIQREIMTLAMRDAYKDGEPDVEAKSFLEMLATDLSAQDIGPPGPPITK